MDTFLSGICWFAGIIIFLNVVNLIRKQDVAFKNTPKNDILNTAEKNQTEVSFFKDEHHDTAISCDLSDGIYADNIFHQNNN